MVSYASQEFHGVEIKMFYELRQYTIRAGKMNEWVEFMEGEIFDEMIENLNLQAQEEKLNNLN